MAESHNFSNLFLDENCEEKVIYKASEGWGGRCAGHSYEDFESTFIDGEEIRTPAMSITNYQIGDKVYRSYGIEETEREKAEKCEEFIGALCPKSEKFYAETEIDGLIGEQRERLGIKEEWTERKKLQWEKIADGKYPLNVSEH